MIRDGSSTGTPKTDPAATNALIFFHVGVLILGIVVQHVVASATGDGAPMKTFAVVVGLVSFAAVLGACTRPRLFKSVASARFGVVSLTTLALLSILGTVVLQSVSQEVLSTTYGSLTPLLEHLFLDDIFHSFGFAALMGMASAALVATVFEKRRLTIRRYGILGAHLGCVVTLLGSAVGSVWGVKGRVNLHVSEQSSLFLVRDDGGQMHEHPLGFTLRLDDFELLRYEPEFRLRIYEMKPGGQKLVASFDPADPKAARKLGAHGVELVGYWPDHRGELQVKDAPEPAVGQPRIAALSLMPPGADARKLWLLDQGSPQGGRLHGTRETDVRFVWDEKRARSLLGDGQPASEHVVVVGDEKLVVQVGRTYELPGGQWSIRILSAFKDFVIDPETRKPSERSSSPNNPALQVQVMDTQGHVVATRWIFANFPSFDHNRQQAGPPLRYVYAGGDGTLPIGIILVGEIGRVWTVEGGEIQKDSPLKVGTRIVVEEVTLTVTDLHASASVTASHSSASDRALNPVAEVRLGRDPSTRLMGPGEAVELDADRILALTPKGDDVRDYLSKVSVLEGDRVVATRTVEVNHPLRYGGFAIYQSDYDPADPTFSGFEVVKDPGIPLVYLGLVMMILAVGHVYLVVPVVRRLRKRSSTARQQGGTP